MRRRRIAPAVACVIVGLVSWRADGAQPAPTPRSHSLAGVWRFLLDPADRGLSDRVWEAGLPDRIALPGSTDQGRFGSTASRPPDFQRMDRVFEYVGAAWYQRDVVIPYAWRRRRITLFLERCHWETRVWLDGRFIGMRDSLSAPHVYDLTGSAGPGTRRLTIRVDNRLKHPIGAWANAVSEETQTNWNGIIGRIELRGTARVWVENVRTYPDPARDAVRIVATIGNVTAKPVTASLTHRIGAVGELEEPTSVVAGVCEPGYTRIETTATVASAGSLWSEFSPRVMALQTGLKATDGVTTWVHDADTTFGMRAISSDLTHFRVNGRRTYLRGTVEGCVFPLTGYPPMDVASWARIFSIARSFGLNHMRFHSWCPPEAAFAAADAAGFLLQVETPAWVTNIGRHASRDRYLAGEAQRIVDTYGNHPSFALFSLGHELAGDRTIAAAVIERIRRADPRHLYTSSTGSLFGSTDNYAVVRARAAGSGAGVRDARVPVGRPEVAHEIGRWAVFPDIREIGRFTGVLRPGNLLRVQDGLRRLGTLTSAGDLVRTTGRGSLVLLKGEIEARVGDPTSAGFQMLSLSDFMGHGTATVGLLNSLWEDKRIAPPEEVRRFCGPTVPLAVLPRRTFVAGETLNVRVSVAHYGARGLSDAAVSWSLATGDGSVVGRGGFAGRAIPVGDVTDIGAIRTALPSTPTAQRLSLTVTVEGSAATNAWSLWVYPRPPQSNAVPDDVLVSDALDDRVVSALRDGRRVLLLGGSYARRSLKGSATPVYWSPIALSFGPLTMGIRCDPSHPALRGFPTDAWGEQQWTEILERSRSLVIGAANAQMDTVVGIVDNFARSLPLALVAEARVGPGRLLMCGADLTTDLDRRPASAHLRRCLLAYAASDAFRPRAALDAQTLHGLLVHSTRDAVRRGPPLDVEAPALHVIAARRMGSDADAAWTPMADAVVRRAAGYGYSVKGRAVRDGSHTGWRDATALTVTLATPRRVGGTLSVRLHDWRGEGRVAQVELEGRFVETVADYGRDGVWLSLPVTPADTTDGRVVVSVRPEGADDTVAEVAFIAARGPGAPPG